MGLWVGAVTQGFRIKKSCGPVHPQVLDYGLKNSWVKAWPYFQIKISGITHNLWLFFLKYIVKGQRYSSVAEHLHNMYEALGFLFVCFWDLACICLPEAGIGMCHHAWLNLFTYLFLRLTVFKSHSHINIRKKIMFGLWTKHLMWGVGMIILSPDQFSVFWMVFCFVLLQLIFSLTIA